MVERGREVERGGVGERGSVVERGGVVERGSVVEGGRVVERGGGGECKRVWLSRQEWYAFMDSHTLTGEDTGADPL